MSHPTLWLLTPEEFDQLPDGTVVESINVNKPELIKGTDYIDRDVRFGYMAYGIRDIEKQPEEVRFLLQTFLLRK